MTTVTGQLRYVKKRVDYLIKQGFKVLRTHTHPDNSITVTLER